MINSINNNNALISMRAAMSQTPRVEDDAICFVMKRVQQCVWILTHKTNVNGNILKLFKHIVSNSMNTLSEAAINGCYIWMDDVNSETLSEMDDALARGINKIRAKLSPEGKKEELWGSIWEFCVNAWKGESDWYPSDIVVRNPAEYKAWLDRVLVLVEEAFK